MHYSKSVKNGFFHATVTIYDGATDLNSGTGFPLPERYTIKAMYQAGPFTRFWLEKPFYQLKISSFCIVNRKPEPFKFSFFQVLLL